MLRLRQRLLPYLYTLFEQAHRTGAPILRPLLFEYPDDETTYSTDDEFLVGSENAALPEHGVHQCGLAVVNVGDNGDIANLFGHVGKSVFRQK